MIEDHDLIVMQGVSIPVIFLVAVFGGVIPYLFKNNQKFETILSYMNIASAGILIGVALLHIFPETGETLNGECNDYPVSYVITFIAIILMSFLLKTGHNHSHHHHDEESEKLLDTEQGENHEHHEHEHHHHDEQKANFKSPIMLLIGLFIHDVSEGLALGFSQSFDDCLFLFIAVLLHKWCDVTCEVICGIREGLSLKQNIYLMIPLTLATPIAQLIGFLICLCSDTNTNDSLGYLITEDVFMSFAAGTFTTICFLEIMAEEFEGCNIKQLTYKALTMVAGFVVIALSSVVEVVSESEE